jgi:hypothetical protein
MHRTRFIFGLTASFLAAGIVVIAGQGHGGAKPAHAPKTPKPAAAMQPKATKPASAPKALKPAPAPKTIKPAAAQKSVKPVNVAKPVKAAKPTKASSPAPAKAPKALKTAKADKPATLPKKNDTSDKTTRVSTPPAAPTATVALTPVQQKLQKNTNLASKLTSRLPPGTDLMTAASGFRNLGQFVAAVNVSNNLDIPFAQLKTRMVTENKSLGQSIQSLKPAASATIEAQHAEYDARGMIAESEQQPQATVVPASKSPARTKK